MLCIFSFSRNEYSANVQCTQTVIQFICEAQRKYHRMQIMMEKQTVTFFFFSFFFFLLECFEIFFVGMSTQLC